MIERTKYLEELKIWKDKDVIKVVTGMWGCGKSILFKQFINYLKDNEINENEIIHINLESALYGFKNYKEFYDYINSKIDSKKKYYVF